MYAVIVSGGKQYPVTKDELVRLEKLDAKPGASVEFDQIALYSPDDGEVVVGTPWIEGATVTGEVVGHGRGEKVRIIKMRRRKNYRRHQGHRQDYTEVRIGDINLG